LTQHKTVRNSRKARQLPALFGTLGYQKIQITFPEIPRNETYNTLQVYAKVLFGLELQRLLSASNLLTSLGGWNVVISMCLSGITSSCRADRWGGRYGRIGGADGIGRFGSLGEFRESYDIVFCPGATDLEYEVVL
jgi:hypothetical protein